MISLTKIIRDITNPVKESVLNSLLGEAESTEVEFPTTPPAEESLLSAELGRFIDQYQRSDMSESEVAARLIYLERLRTAQSLSEQRLIIEQLRRACS